MLKYYICALKQKEDDLKIKNIESMMHKATVNMIEKYLTNLHPPTRAIEKKDILEIIEIHRNRMDELIKEQIEINNRG